MGKDLLFELGLEEVPAKFIPPVLSQLKELAEKTFADKRIGFGEVKTYATPRRFTLYITDLAEKQTDAELEVKGPPAKAAYDAEGKPTKAALGFAKGQGVKVEDLYTKTVEGGDYVFALKREAGQKTMDLLPDILHSLVTGLTFPKYMRWGDHDLKYVRPIRWIVALFGEDVVPYEIAGVKAGRESRGHRFLAKGPIRIDRPEEYKELLWKGYVLVDQDERRRRILQQIREEAAKIGGRLVEDEDLLEEVTYLVEYPTAVLGSVKEEFMSLPREVIITPMREHQRYFPVEDGQGKLLPYFITVRNGTADHLAIVRQGNERVLTARLDDAKFFFHEDTKKPLHQYVDSLKGVVFQEQLGTLYEKMERVKSLALWMVEQVGGDQQDKVHAERAATLCKADLVTNMVKEFTELQGVMGRHYAILSGEDQEVAEAIYEHYLPRFSGDQLPKTLVGRALAIADKIDTVVGYFSIGLQPTGSQDPYGLRRQALGIINILLDAKWNLSLLSLVRAVQKVMFKGAFTADERRLEEAVLEFLLQRIKNIFAEQDLRYDVIEAALQADYHHIPHAWLRAKALAAFRETGGFRSLLAAYNRVYNLAKKAEAREIKPELFVEPEETELFTAYKQTQKRVEAHYADGKFADALTEMTALQEPIDRFFARIMVMVDDETVRNNRLALLSAIAALMSRVGDLSKIVID